MNHIATRFVAVVAALVTAFCASAQTIGSDFSSGIDDWKTRDYFTGALGPEPGWAGGSINTTDTMDYTVFSAPGPKFTGDKSSFFGGTISFDVSTQFLSTNTSTLFSLAIGTGSLTLPGSTALHWYGGQPTTSGFKTFTALLTPTDTRWRIDAGPNGGGRLPTEAEFRAVLADVTWLYVAGEWNDGPDFVRLDNVFLSAVPEPSSWILAIGGIAFLAARKSSQRRALPSEA